MYSLVLMTAMTTAPSGPEFNGYFRDLFAGRNCAGCTGSCHGLFGGRIRSFFSFGGGCGGSSCSGRSLASCTGASLSCNGASYSCAGSAPSYSCGGAAYSCGGGAMPFATPEYGVPYATPTPANYGPIVVGYGYPSNGYSYPVPTVPPVEYVPYTTAPPTDLASAGVRTEYASGVKNQLPPPSGPAANRATVVVRLPVDARLYAENQLLLLTSGERTFVTPELPAGREYAYSFKIEYDRNGRTVSEAQKISVAAGKTSTIVFDDLTLGAKPKAGSTAVVEKPEPAKPVSNAVPDTVYTPVAARITVKLPANATLYIDGKKNEKAGEERQFTTPPLPPGKEFSYSMKLEKLKDGRPEEVTQKVAFRAGEVVTVDFTEAATERRVGK